jgi:type I restriction enzyme R subunit
MSATGVIRPPKLQFGAKRSTTLTQSKIGLAATPAAHTTAYFKDVVFRYEYERAVREGYLVDYDVVAIKSNVRMQGIFLKEGETVGIVNPETGASRLESVEDERQFDATEVEQKITSPDSNQKILEEIKRYAVEREQQHGRFPKTPTFAANDLPHTSHADQLRENCVWEKGQSAEPCRQTSITQRRAKTPRPRLVS